jgi:hypothetical protein
VIRHEFRAPNGDHMAIVVEDNGNLRLLFCSVVYEEEECKPREHGHALLRLVADLLIEREGIEDRLREEIRDGSHADGFVAGYAAGLAEMDS